jgi:acyl carrier protein
MIPGVYVEVSQFPLTPNGKVDRNALANPERSRPATTALLPQTDVERSLAEIWQTVLQIDTVGIDDNFFDLGGHSLRMVQLHSAVRDRFDSAIALVDLFRYPTIRSFADWLKHAHQTPPDSRFEAQVNTRIAELTTGKQRLQQRRQQKLTPPPTTGDRQ